MWPSVERNIENGGWPGCERSRAVWNRWERSPSWKPFERYLGRKRRYERTRRISVAERPRLHDDDYGFSADVRNEWLDPRLLAAGRPTRRSRRVSQSVGRACAVSYGESYRGWNEPRAVKDGRHPCELRSSCRNFHPTTSSMCTPCTLKNYVARSSLV